MSTWLERLAALKACPPGLERATRYETFQALWDDLDRGDWMMWALGQGTNVDDFSFIGCAEACALLTKTEVPDKSRQKIAETVTAPYKHGPLASKVETWKRLADVVRHHFPEPPELSSATGILDEAAADALGTDNL